MEENIQVPAAPSGLPPAVQKKWQTAYRAAFVESRARWQKAQEVAESHGGHTNRETQWHRDGLHAANALLVTPDIASYEQAMQLEDWHFVLRSASADGKMLRVVTRHGDKYTFSIPVTAA